MCGQQTGFTREESDFSSGRADEVVEHRGYSTIGAAQRHYVLQPALVTPDGVCTAVVVVTGSKGTVSGLNCVEPPKERTSEWQPSETSPTTQSRPTMWTRRPSVGGVGK